MTLSPRAPSASTPRRASTRPQTTDASRVTPKATMSERRVILCVDAAVATGDDAARATIRAALRDLDDANVSTTTYDEIDALLVAPREPTCDGFYVAVSDGEGATRAGAAAREALRPGGTCAVRVNAALVKPPASR